MAGSSYLDITHGCLFCKYFKLPRKSGKMYTGYCIANEMHVHYYDICAKYVDNMKGNKENDPVLQGEQRTV